MLAYRDGNQIIICDGCWEIMGPAERYKERYRHNRRHMHANRDCRLRARRNAPDEDNRCPDCGERIAHDHVCVCKADNPPPKVPT